MAIGRWTTPTSTPGTAPSSGWTGTISTANTFVSLEIIPDTATPVRSFTITATQGGATSGGMLITPRVISGQNASPIGASTTDTALSTSITPTGNGSIVFGSLLATSGTLTPVSGTTLIQDSVSSLEFGTFECIGSVSGTPETVGVTSSGSGINLALLEILAGSGSLNQFVGAGDSAFSVTTTATTAPVSPPAGSILVLLVSSNGSSGTTTISVDDTSGLGLTWVEQVKLNPTNNGYAGIWTAEMPSTVPTTLFGQTGTSSNVTNDSASYTLGTQFTPAQDTKLTGIWFYSGGTADQLPSGCAIFESTGGGTGSVVSGTRNDAAGWSGAAGSGWVRCGFDGSVTLTATGVYKVVIEKQAGVNVYTGNNHYWDGGGLGNLGITSGTLTAPNNATADGGQSTYDTGTWPAYPHSEFNASNYWLDVEVMPASTDASVTGVGAAVSVDGGIGSVSTGSDGIVIGVSASVSVDGGIGSVTSTSNVAITGVGASIPVAGGIGATTATANQSITGVGASVPVAGGIGVVSTGTSATVTGIGAAVSVSGGVGSVTTTSSVSVTGIGASIPVLGGVGSVNATRNVSVTGVAAIITVAGGVGEAVSGGAGVVTGQPASVSVSGGIGAVSASVEITGTGAAVTVAGGIGSVTATASAHITGVSAPITVAGGVGAAQAGSAGTIIGVGAAIDVSGGIGSVTASSPDAVVTGLPALVTVSGGIGTLSADQVITGEPAIITVSAGTGVPFGSAVVTGTPAAVVCTAGTGSVSAGATIAGTAGVITVAAGVGIPSALAAKFFGRSAISGRAEYKSSITGR